MTPLNNQQKQLLFDYCIGVTSAKQAAEIEELIASNAEASEIHSKLKAALAPLETLEPQTCPDELVEGTIWRLNNLAHSSQLQLQHLLEAEQARTAPPQRPFWHNLSKIAGVAAVILIAAAIWFPSFGFARQKYWLRCCQAQLARMGQGVTLYSRDHDGALPAVAIAKGAPLWKVGYQGSEDHSNTRNMWLLVKGNYVEPADFVCPGRKQGRVIRRAIRLSPSQVKSYRDFPSRAHVTYSCRVRCIKSARALPHGRKVLIADLSPLFENLPADFSKPFRLELNRELLILNSINHNRHGQNVLFFDGSVKFTKERHTDVSEDDIFTLQEMRLGSEVRGCELPSCESDDFLAP
jgi:prepilin-type processing-associated H-X9-DG protein